MDDYSFFQEYEIWFLLVGGLAMYFLATPCVIKLTMRLRRNFSLDEIDPDRNPPPSEVEIFFDRTGKQLEPSGFHLIHQFLIPDLIANGILVFAIFENRERGDAAIAVVGFVFQDSSQKKVNLQQRYIQISTDFADGTEIVTNNNRQESPLQPMAHRRLIQIQKADDAGLLHMAHEQFVERFGKPPKAPLPEPDQWAEEIRRGLTLELTEQLDTGYLKMDASQEFFVPTWKGAYLMTWKLLWPISQMRRTSRRKKARDLLSQCGIVISR